MHWGGCLYQYLSLAIVLVRVLVLSTVPVSGIRPLLHNYPASEKKTLSHFQIQVRRGGAFASHEFGLLPGCRAGWCLRLTFASSSARGLGRASQLWRSFWDYMVCVLDSSSLCAWSGFMRDASRLDSSFFSSSFLFPFFDLRISLARYNCRSWHRAVAYFTFGFFIYFILFFPFSVGQF